MHAAVFGALLVVGSALAPGPNVRILLEDKPADHATLSPAGDRIVFRQGAHGEGGVVELFRNGEGRSLVGDEKSRAYGTPRFSPQGLYLLLEVMDTRNGQTKAIEVRRVADGKRLIRHSGSSATWGPAGDQLAVVHPRVGVMIVGFPDGQVRHFIPVESKSKNNFPRAVFSPSGEMIAVVDFPAPETARLRCVELATGKAATLSTQSEGEVDIRPFWSPDNSKLAAFMRANQRGQNASTISVWDLSGPRSLPRSIYTSTGLDPVHTPAFSPDGQEIVLIHRDVDSGRTDAFAVPSSGGRATRLTELGDVTGSVRWVNGRSLVVEGGTRIYVVNR